MYRQVSEYTCDGLLCNSKKVIYPQLGIPIVQIKNSGWLVVSVDRNNESIHKEFCSIGCLNDFDWEVV